ncbi:MAG: ATP-dependent nuclease [Pseudomonadota bacterium]
MHIRKIFIENFRCIRSLSIVLGKTTVIIGENNAGKTAILDAVKIALGRRWGTSGQTGFTEYDFRKGAEGAAPAPVVIRLSFWEEAPDEWPRNLVDDLVSITRIDPNFGTRSIEMQVRCTFEDISGSVEPVWEFLNEQGEAYAGSGARNQNLAKFFDYVPSFSMAAMRDAGVEFGRRSRFWTSLLRTIKVDPALAADLESRFAALNDELLSADPKLDTIKRTLKQISSVIANGAAGDVDVRAIPLNIWEIISKAEVVVKGNSVDPWLPIGKHGQGVQSLAIIFLFRAFVENALGEPLPEEAEPILTLEEPEAHLHPQACRSLWDSISALPGQKIVTTHSPYFVQNVPFKDLVILRRCEDGPKPASLPQLCSAQVPENERLRVAVGKIGPNLKYNAGKKRLECRGELTEDQFRELLKCYTDHNRTLHHAMLRNMKEESLRFIADAEIRKLESWAKRIRGEIFFASKWLLCEGQSDYAILGAIAEKLNCPLDAHGISVIDYQNNGSAGAFAALARSLQFNWAMICDGDQGGDDHIAQLKSHQFSNATIAERVTQLSQGVDLEKLIISSPLRPFMLAAIQELEATIADEDDALLLFASANKEEVAVRAAAHIRNAPDALEIPESLSRPFKIIGAF